MIRFFGVAGLAGVTHAGLLRMLGRRRDVVGIDHDVRVRTAEFEHALLQVASGDVHDHFAYAPRAGE